MFVTLAGQIYIVSGICRISAHMQEEVYTLLFNTEILFHSRNITVLHGCMHNRCKADGHRVPESYHTVRRRILAEGKYVHEPVLGYTYSIIQRQLIHKPVQHKLGLFSQDTATASGGGK